MNCEICGTSPLKNSRVILTRVNGYGVKGIWRCQEHLTEEQRERRDSEAHEVALADSGDGGAAHTRYKTVVADPPWPYNIRGPASSKEHRPNSHW